ncbi:MAG TPA: type 1 glutamine amidotransferase [Actinomycetota bacterium]|jgi:GMP synthase-like glutamine amidotransferase|nr:type 1 glutamine amidotransferase [Actinomycetota bacterium]
MTEGLRALVVKPHHLSATGFIGERLRERGFELVEHVAADGGAMPSAEGFDAVVVMGSPWSVHGPEVGPWIGGLLELLREADERGTGVFGVCFGAQSLAAAFGAEVYRGELEFGWHEVESADPELVPAGPWFMWHSDRFDLPDGATELARTEANGPQAYAFGPHLCVQFHPEADTGIVSAWVGHDSADLDAAGAAREAVLDETATREPEARRRAYALVDAFLERAGVPSGR